MKAINNSAFYAIFFQERSLSLISLAGRGGWQFLPVFKNGLRVDSILTDCTLGNYFKVPHPKDFMTSQEQPFIRANLGDKTRLSLEPTVFSVTDDLGNVLG